MGFNDEAFLFADSSCPPIEKLTYYWFYVVKSGDSPRLKKVPELHVRHKEPDDKWWDITEIPIQFNQQIAKSYTTSNVKTSRNDEKIVYFTIKEIKSQKGKNRLDWNKICEKMSEMQKNGEVNHYIDFSTVKTNTVIKWFSRMKKEYETNNN